MGIRWNARYIESFAQQKEVNFNEQTVIRFLSDESPDVEKEPLTQYQITQLQFNISKLFRISFKKFVYKI